MAHILTYTGLTTQPGHAAEQARRDALDGGGSLVAIHNTGKATFSVFPQMLQIFKLLLQCTEIDEV